MTASIFDLPEITKLPDWAEPALLEDFSTGSLVILALLALLAFRFIRKVVGKIIVISLLAIIAIGIWEQRNQLQGCINPCQCSLFGQAVHIPIEHNPRCHQT